MVKMGVVDGNTALTIRDLNPPGLLEAYLGKPTSRHGKQHHRRVLADGYTFDSEAEYRRYQHLRLLVAAGEIRDLMVHPKYEILPAFRSASGVRHSAVRYTADFAYTRDGKPIVEDVKAGKRTKTGRISTYTGRDFTMRRKLFQSRYPHLFFYLVYWLERCWHEKAF